MMGCPHFVQGTVPSGGKSPGMKTFVSHQPHVTIRKGLSLMPEVNLAPRRNPTTQFSRKNPFDKRAEMMFIARG